MTFSDVVFNNVVQIDENTLFKSGKPQNFKYLIRHIDRIVNSVYSVGQVCCTPVVSDYCLLYNVTLTLLKRYLKVIER